MTQKSILKYAASIGACLLTAFVAWVAISTSYVPWYVGLGKSSLHVSDTTCAIIWAILFGLMAIATGKVWIKGFYHKWVQVALYHFGFLLILTGFWFMLFFGLKQPLFAFLDLIALIVLLFITIKWYKIVDDKAAYLLYPSVIWIVYVAILNFEVWRLN